jgi:hypothetical protein
MMTTAEIATRQAEFLNALSSLLNKYEAEIYIDNRREDCGGPMLGIDACGTWIPYHEFGTRFGVDGCIKATEATINFAMAVI